MDAGSAHGCLFFRVEAAHASFGLPQGSLGTTYLVYVRGGLRRGGLMPAQGFAHARNGQGCRQIEAVNATVLPRGASSKLHG